MVATEHDRSFDFATGDKFIEDLAHLRAFTISQPADACRKALKRYLVLRLFNPGAERFVLRKCFKDRSVCAINILGFARQCDPAERTLAVTEERSDVFGNETGNRKCVFQTVRLGLTADIVAVVEHDRPLLL